jgi:hypothetical protein
MPQLGLADNLLKLRVKPPVHIEKKYVVKRISGVTSRVKDKIRIGDIEIRLSQSSFHSA